MNVVDWAKTAELPEVKISAFASGFVMYEDFLLGSFRGPKARRIVTLLKHTDRVDEIAVVGGPGSSQLRFAIELGEKFSLPLKIFYLGDNGDCDLDPSLLSAGNLILLDTVSKRLSYKYRMERYCMSKPNVLVLDFGVNVPSYEYVLDYARIITERKMTKVFLPYGSGNTVKDLDQALTATGNFFTSIVACPVGQRSRAVLTRLLSCSETSDRVTMSPSPSFTQKDVDCSHALVQSKGLMDYYDRIYHEDSVVNFLDSAGSPISGLILT